MPYAQQDVVMEKYRGMNISHSERFNIKLIFPYLSYATGVSKSFFPMNISVLCRDGTEMAETQ
jgi:hypothetical protein